MISKLDMEAQDDLSIHGSEASDGRPSTANNSRPGITDPNVQTLPDFSSSASMSPRQMASQIPSTSSRRPVSFSPVSAAPFALSQPSSSSPLRRSTRFMDDHHIIVTESLPTAEKDADDPNSPDTATSPGDRKEYSTASALSTFLASEVTAASAQSGTLPRKPNPDRSYPSLPSHLYTRGLLGGRHSDIAITAFGHKYNLHRIILDRAPFFANALTEPWLEASAKETELHPEDTDKNITETAFELALKSLYGVDISEEGESEALGLFATGCWLEMQELVDASMDSLLRQMSPENLAPLIVTMTEHYYGRAGERILASAKAMLCRDGWEMPLKNWDGIPGETIREIVGNDGFFINGEWERWVLAKRLLDRRLKQKAVECGLIEANNLRRVQAPKTISLRSIRYDTLYQKNVMTTGSQNPANQTELWISLYTNPDIEPILVLLDEGIHYIHLEFEQLQCIRQTRDVFGIPVLPDSVITNALWMQLELRQKVLNARQGDLELGLSKPAEPRPSEPASQTPSDSQYSKGKRRLSDAIDFFEPSNDGDMESGNWNGNARPRKFWIPSIDCNIVIGGNAEPVITTNTSSTLLRYVNRLSAAIEPPDVQWATDFASSPSTNVEGINRPTTPAGRAIENDGGSGQQPKPISYTTFPPFRFAVEFPNPKLLKEKKRVYSRTVFYAGSLWNIYIQRVRSQKNPQLGVYLHRRKERENEDVISSIGGSLGGGSISNSGLGSVDERIGLLEREMILRGEQRHNHARLRDAGSRLRSTLDTIRSPNRENVTESDASTLVPDSETASLRPPFMRQSSGRPNRHDGGVAALGSYIALDSDTDSDTFLHWSESDIFSTAPPKLPPFRTVCTAATSTATAMKSHTATLSPYVDPRPRIKTYFKIYSPSKGGRLLSVYESAPDKFDFSQSWGWRSSTLMLDEAFLQRRQQRRQQQEAEVSVTQEAEDTISSAGGAEATVGGAELNGKEVRERERRRNDGILRFMVVIGNL